MMNPDHQIEIAEPWFWSYDLYKNYRGPFATREEAKQDAHKDQVPTNDCLPVSTELVGGEEDD